MTLGFWLMCVLRCYFSTNSRVVCDTYRNSPIDRSERITCHDYIYNTCHDYDYPFSEHYSFNVDKIYSIRVSYDTPTIPNEKNFACVVSSKFLCK